MSTISKQFAALRPCQGRGAPQIFKSTLVINESDPIPSPTQRIASQNPSMPRNETPTRALCVPFCLAPGIANTRGQAVRPGRSQDYDRQHTVALIRINTRNVPARIFSQCPFLIRQGGRIEGVAHPSIRMGMFGDRN